MTGTTDIQPERLLIEFLNTLDVERCTDLLDDEVGYRAWAESRNLEPGPIEEARDIRNALRDLVAGTSCTLPEVNLRTVATGGGVLLSGNTAPETAVAIATVLTIRDQLSRVKLCPCADCREAFFDRSRNSSRVWCDMAVCGNREKSRTFRGKPEDD